MDHKVFQVNHIPIGNRVGRIAVEAVAGLAERRFADTSILQNFGLRPKDWHWTHALFGSRHVDDLWLPFSVPPFLSVLFLAQSYIMSMAIQSSRLCLAVTVLSLLMYTCHI